MTTLNAFARQPSTYDFASPVQFKFSIVKMPLINFFCTTVNLPGISITPPEQVTALKDIPIPGDKVAYADLNLTFMVDEKYENYRQLQDWITGKGFPKEHAQFRNYAKSNADLFPASADVGYSSEAGKVTKPIQDLGFLYSDAVLTFNTSKNNPTVRAKFTDLFPTSLGGLNYTTQATDVEYLSCDATFSYAIYELETV